MKNDGFKWGVVLPQLDSSTLCYATF